MDFKRKYLIKIDNFSKMLIITEIFYAIMSAPLLYANRTNHIPKSDQLSEMFQSLFKKKL